jgi:hypothetical protein
MAWRAFGLLSQQVRHKSRAYQSASRIFICGLIWGAITKSAVASNDGVHLSLV